MTFSTSPSLGVALQGGGGSGGGGAASAPLTGTGAIITTSQPLIDVSQTWNNAAVTFTGAKLNITDTASNASSLLMDLQVGGVSQASIDKRGNLSFAAPASGATPTRPGVGNWFNTLALFGNSGALAATVSSATINFGTSYQLAWNTDLILTRRGAANLRLGAADAAAPVAQTLSVQSVVALTSNTAGQVFRIDGSQSTGNAAGGAIEFRVSPAGGAGSAVNALATALTIGAGTSGGGPTLTASRALITSYGGSTATGQQGMCSLGFDSNSGLLTIGSPSGITTVSVASTGRLGFAGSSANWSDIDVSLYRDAANKLALRNGAAAQRFNVYNTWTSTTNYEAFKIDWITTANTVLVGTEKGSGGGTARALAFQTDGTTRLTINTNGSIDLGGTSQINASGTYQAGGASGGAALATTGLFIGSGEQVKWSSTGAWSGAIDIGLSRAAAGVVGVTNGSTGAGALQFIEQTAPAAPAANGVRIYAEDNGSGKTRLMALFATGAAQQIAIEP